MEKRYGAILILIRDFQSVSYLNSILSDYSAIILSRTGLPVHDKKMSLISLIVEGTSQEINALAGKIGRISMIEVKSCMHKPLAESD